MALNTKLKSIIYNVQARDEYSVDLPDYGQCQYVYGGPEQEDHFHCGHPVGYKSTGIKSSYCQTHHDLCYRPRRAKKKK